MGRRRSSTLSLDGEPEEGNYGGVDVVQVGGGGSAAEAGVGAGVEEDAGFGEEEVLPLGEVARRVHRGNGGVGVEGGEKGTGVRKEVERGAKEINGDGGERRARRKKRGMGEGGGEEEGVGLVAEDKERGGVDRDEGVGGEAVDLEGWVTATGGGSEGEEGRRRTK